jgi:truncated hemoglobin YjbI
MLDALEEVPPPEPVRSTMIEYFVRSADFMRNTPDPEPTGQPSL